MVTNVKLNPLSFKLGRILITPAARNRIIETVGNNLSDVMIHQMTLLVRHKRLDRGDLDDADHEANKTAVSVGDRIFSSFTDQHGSKFWVITEADRSQTTILLPEDY